MGDAGWQSSPALAYASRSLWKRSSPEHRWPCALDPIPRTLCPVPGASTRVSLCRSSQVALQTLSPSAIAHLSDGDGKGGGTSGPPNGPPGGHQRGEFLFSSVVRVDYPAFVDGRAGPQYGGARAAPYRTPLTLVMPHCFCSADGKESCVMLGAPHGSTSWEHLGEG